MKLQSATVGDIALSIVLPIAGLIAGLVALIKREFKRGITMLALSGGMLAILAVPLVLVSMEGTAAFRKPFVEFGLVVSAEQVNLTSPRMIDRVTRLDGATAGPGLALTYRYTLMNFDARRIGADVFATRLKGLLTQKVCASRVLGRLLQKNVVLQFSYRQKNGKPIADVVVDRQACERQ